jgi:Tol biopolymer transport system component
MAPNGTYTPDALGLESVIAANPNLGGVNSLRTVRTIPSNLAVVFASDVSGQSEIWTINEDGTGLTQWTTDGGSEPVGSTSQDWLYYRKGQQIWVMGWLSGTLMGGLFADFNAENHPLDVAHKWNGSEYGSAAFLASRYEPVGGPVEYNVTVNGSSGVAYLLITGLPIHSLDNGNHRWVLSLGATGSRQIFLLDGVTYRGPGGNLHQLTFGSMDCVEPVNGLDGRSIYFAGSDGLQWDIYRLDQFSGVVTNVTMTPGIDEQDPSLSPEGGLIVFSRGTGSSHDIYVMKTDGTSLRPLVTGMGDCLHPDFLTLPLP